MLFVFNKQKIYSYLIAASTVVILFILSYFFVNTDMNTVETSSNSIRTNEIKQNENVIQKSE